MKNLVLYIFLLFCISINAQQLYFVRATIDRSVYFNNAPPAQLLQYHPDNDSITVKYDFTSTVYQGYDQLTNIVQYDNINMLILSTMNGRFFSLKIDAPDSISYLDVICPSNYRNPSKIDVIKNDIVYRCRCTGCATTLYNGLDAKSAKSHVITPQLYTDIYLTGSYFYGYSNDLLVVVKPNDSSIYLPVVSDTTQRPPMDIQFPSQYWVKKKTFLTLLINETSKAVFVTDIFPTSKNDSLGKKIYLICNKVENKWVTFALKGNGSYMRSYGHWLVGSIRETIGKTAEYNSQKESPGRAIRKSANISWGFDDRITNMYFPGILYLLNVKTGKYIEWSTGQGDSEILLVQDEIVYYRVFDEIYKVPIINGEKLGKPELLVKDNQVVPFIHWAFFGK